MASIETMTMRCRKSIGPANATLRTANVAFGRRAWLA
jgi:hypothetical protein